VTIEYAIEAIENMEHSLEVTCAEMSLERRVALVAKIFTEAQRLVQFPKAGQVEPWMQCAKHEYRRLVVGNFKIIYRIEGETIYVTDIFDTRHDPKRMRG